jgi:hypothetical protein
MSTSPLTPDLKIRTYPGCGSFSRKRSIYSRFWKGGRLCKQPFSIGGNSREKRIVVAVALGVIVVALVSAHAQTMDSSKFLKFEEDGTAWSVQDAINKGADVNAQDTTGQNALMHAAANNPNPKVITTLLKSRRGRERYRRQRKTPTPTGS